MDIYSLMRRIASLFEKPVVVILLLFIIFSIYIIIDLICEAFQRRYIKIRLAKLLNDIKKKEIDLYTIIKKCRLLKIQKQILFEIMDNQILSNNIRESLAAALLEKYKEKLDSKIKITDMLARIAPSFGLLGTLIPLGPGVIALGQGNTEVLSSSLLTAFDTTILGLVVAVVAIIVSAIRKKWYVRDYSIMSVLMEAVVEEENEKYGGMNA